jgi:serine O-acetyltransferase
MASVTLDAVGEEARVRDDDDAPSLGGESYPIGGAAAGRPFREVLSIMREDWETHGRDVTQPGLHAVLLQRYAAWQLGLPSGPRRKALSAIRRILWTLVRNVYGIELHDTARIGRRVRIEHQGAIIIDGKAVIGDGCLIRHNVTIGLAQEGGGAPRIGKDVHIAPGAVLAGDITIGDRARIGPNAVVVVDVAADTTAFAPPARQLRNAGSEQRESRNAGN